MIRRLFAPFILLFLSLAAVAPSYGATTLLPNGEQCFQSATGPLSSGSVNMFQVGTTIPKTTWKDSGQVTANTQPIHLDANGCAIIYGVGAYRQQVYDGPVVGGVATGNLIFDQTTTDTSAYNSVFWAGLAGGTPNVITITDTGFNATDGSVINFIALSTNTGATTINPSGFGAIVVEKDTTGGPVALVGGEIIQSNSVSVVYRASDNAFHILNPPIQSASLNSAPLCGASGFRGVNDSGTPNTKFTMTATDAVMVSAIGQAINRSSVSVTVNFSINGANGLDTGAPVAATFYYLYLIDNGSAPAGLASLSSTSPTLPTGYTYLCRLAAVEFDGSVHLFKYLMSGKTAVVTASLLHQFTAQTGACGTPTFTSTTLTNLPTTAGQAIGNIYQNSANRIGIGTSATTAFLNTNVQGENTAFAVPIQNQLLWLCNDNGGGVNSITVIGWVDTSGAN